MHSMSRRLAWLACLGMGTCTLDRARLFLHERQQTHVGGGILPMMGLVPYGLWQTVRW